LVYNSQGIKTGEFLERRADCRLFTKLEKKQGKLDRNTLLYLLGGLET
jgi:hypothetical protein